MERWREGWRWREWAEPMLWPRPFLRPPSPTAPFANPAYRLLLATYAQPMGGLACTPPDGAKPINTDGEATPTSHPAHLWP